jgi:Fic family protein
MERKKAIILDLLKNQALSSKEIFDRIPFKSSNATVKRIISALLEDGLISAEGKGKSTRYSISPASRLLQPILPEEYFKKEIDVREIAEVFNLALLRDLFYKVPLFNKEESEHLQALQKRYEKKVSEISATEFRKEQERLAIDLSWKSSQIEGNTYSLIETEILLKEKQTSSGKTKEEAIMLLNHKDALDFIIENPNYIHPLTVAKIEAIHSILIKDLGVEKNIRRGRVGISGTNYKPLDNEFQIKEALEEMCDLVNSKKNVFEKALLLLLLISYIQPFADGNKRTARILNNAILVDNNY